MQEISVNMQRWRNSQTFPAHEYLMFYTKLSLHTWTYFVFAATCEDPGVNANSLRIIEQDYSPNTVVFWICNDGYRMQGPASMTCLDGRWVK